MKSIIRAIFSSIVAILSKIAKFFLSIPSWLVSLFKAIGSFFMICLLWVKRLLLSGWSITKSFFAKARSIRKPSWFQWNIFPKDGQPPTQSLFEIVIYLICLWFCVDLFIDFNKIPNSNIIIEADKLYSSHYVTLDTIRYKYRLEDEDIPLLIKYNRADIYYSINMNTFIAPDSNKTSYFAVTFHGEEMPTDNRFVDIENEEDDEDDDWIELKSKLSPYWYRVFEESILGSGLRLSLDYEKYKSFKKDVNDIYQLESGIYYNNREELLDLVPDSIFDDMMSFFRFKISSNIIKDNNSYSNLDTTWNGSTNTQYLFDKDICEKRNYKVPKVIEYEAFRSYNEINEEQKYLSLEFFYCNNCSNELFTEYLDSCTHYGVPITNWAFEQLNKDEDFSQGLNITNSGWNRNIASEAPRFFDRHDISQGWFNFTLNTSNIDSINLTINFGGATDFYPMKIEPDEIGSNYIKYTDQVKLLKIRAEGLTFYAKFKEMENIQTIRCFGVTALISGLIIIILTFFILGLYRTLKVFGNYLFKNRNVQ